MRRRLSASVANYPSVLERGPGGSWVWSVWSTPWSGPVRLLSVVSPAHGSWGESPPATCVAAFAAACAALRDSESGLVAGADTTINGVDVRLTLSAAGAAPVPTGPWQGLSLDEAAAAMREGSSVALLGQGWTRKTWFANEQARHLGCRVYAVCKTHVGVAGLKVELSLIHI